MRFSKIAAYRHDSRAAQHPPLEVLLVQIPQHEHADHRPDRCQNHYQQAATGLVVDTVGLGGDRQIEQKRPRDEDNDPTLQTLLDPVSSNLRLQSQILGDLVHQIP